MKRALLILGWLLAWATLASGQTITAVAINPTGFDASISISNFTDLGTVATGLGTNNNPTSAYIVFTVTRPTYYGGTAGTVVDTVYGTANIRYAYPSAWAATTAHALNDRVADATTHCNSGNNGCVQKVVTCSGTCTSGSSTPTWTSTGGTCGSPLPLGCTTIDNSGANQITWKNEGTLPKQGAPPTIQAYDDNISTAGTVVVRVSLSDFIYSVDTVTVTIAAGFYHDNGPGGSGNLSSALPATSVTNNSAMTYGFTSASNPGTKPFCRATWPGYERVTANFPVEVLCASRFARNQSEVESVVFTATDAHSNSVSVTATSMTLSYYNQPWTNASVPYASGPGDPVHVYVYSAVIPVSTLTQGDQITVTWLAYPWAGDSTAVFNSAVGQDGSAQPSEFAGPLYYILDKTGAYGSAFATVKTTGSDSTCTGRVFNTRAAAEADSGLLTMAKAASCIEAYNNTNYSRADAGGGMILMGASSTWTTGNSQFALGTMSTWLVVDKVSTLTPSQVVFTTQGNNGLPDSDHNTLLKYQNVTIGGTNFELVFGPGATGTDSIWIHDCAWSDTSTSPIVANGGATYVTQTTAVQGTGFFYYNSGTNRMPYAIERGNFLPPMGAASDANEVSDYAVIGNYGALPGEVLPGNGASQGDSDGSIVAYNLAYYAQNGSTIGSLLGTSGTSYTKGAAWLQSIFEGGIIDTAAVSDTQTTTVTVNNIILHHVVIGTGGNTTNNSRSHVAYDTAGAINDYFTNWSLRWNNWVLFNLEQDASSLVSPNPARVGGWPVDYGAGTLGNITQNTGFNADFMGLGFPGTSQNPEYVNGAQYFGNYTILSNSANIGLAPWTTVANEALPYDLNGTPRTCPVGVGCTAGAYVYNNSFGLTGIIIGDLFNPFEL